MHLKNDLNSSSLATSSPSSNSVELSAPKPSNSIAPSQSQQISSTDRQALKPRDRAADQRAEARERKQMQKTKDFLSDAQQIEADIEQLLLIRSKRLAQVVTDAPHRFHELVAEEMDALTLGYDYTEHEAHNAAIRDMWKD